MAGCYTIGELAEAGGVPRSTLRYYERSGLMAPTGRTDGNYRYYDTEALERLRFIRAAQAAGFTLTDVSGLLDLRDGSRAPCREVETLIEKRLAEITAKRKELWSLEEVLRASLQLCRATLNKSHCDVIENLSGDSPDPRAND